MLVDNASRDATPTVIRDFASHVPVEDLVHVTEPRPGQSRALNAGLARATGDICAFTDDDCYVQSDFLVEISRLFDDPAVGYAGGRVLLHDPDDARATIKEDLVGSVIEAFRFFVPGTIIGANMAISRRALKTTGGFDPLLGPGTGLVAGDLDLLARACWSGWKGLYDAAPVVSHHHRRKPGPDVRDLYFSYAYGRGAYYMKWILHRASRGVYLREWYARSRRRLAEHDRVTVRCELSGAMRYLARRARSSETAPRF